MRVEIVIIPRLDQMKFSVSQTVEWEDNWSKLVEVPLSAAHF